MIFSKQSLETSLAYIGAYFNKVLSIDLDKDMFFPIKVNDEEWRMVPIGMTYSQWFKWALSREWITDTDISFDEFLKFSDTEFLKSLNKPYVARYTKRVNGEPHKVELIFLKIGETTGYLYVMDLTRLHGGD